MAAGLHIRFDAAAAFREEYARNIQKGGAFIRTTKRFELRAVVNVEIELAWCGESVRLEAEIVHATPQGTDPAQAGVAVQFLEPIDLSGYPPETADDIDKVRELSADVRSRMQTAIDELRGRRRHIFFGSIFRRDGA